MSAAGGIIATMALLLSAYCFIRQSRKRRVGPPVPSYDLTPWGEVIQFPHEMRPARKGGGGRSEQGGRAGTHKVIAHDRERF